jgi:hypothetical protein
MCVAQVPGCSCDDLRVDDNEEKQRSESFRRGLRWLHYVSSDVAYMIFTIMTENEEGCKQRITIAVTLLGMVVASRADNIGVVMRGGCRSSLV